MADSVVQNGPLLYAISDGPDGPVKIGVSTNLERRLCTLQIGAGRLLTVLGSKPGTRADEKKVHAGLWGSRLRGEWFARTPEVERFIATLNPQADPRRFPRGRRTGPDPMVKFTVPLQRSTIDWLKRYARASAPAGARPLGYRAMARLVLETVEAEDPQEPKGGQPS